ncbi:unnamed protein product [Callosobruchus maculatus]|uniref:Uncharacterized protein n=1 Tax=Callosobruchus maculatus TaxID=64391 RepID=A0A653C035_CALMS|nr:unnamed protein product [Callosobruchus maculatus]
MCTVCSRQDQAGNFNILHISEIRCGASTSPAHEVFDTSASTREAQHLENQGITVFMLTFTSASDIEEHIESATVTKCDANQDPDRLVKLDQLVCWK